MKVLVVGNGGREHALAWKLAQSPLIKKVFVAPGNAGTYREPNVENVAIDPMDFAELANFAKVQQLAFTVVGPETPLVAGIVDYFQAKNLLCLGPTQACAQLEGSKVFSKAFMEKYNIPTASAKVFTEAEPAYQYLSSCAFPVVIKADGLAAGKGVIIAQDLTTAKATIAAMLVDQRFGEAGKQFIIETFLRGEELSFIVLCDGQHYIPLATSQDHKARDNDDKGPNTGGMGAYSPAPVSAHLEAKILRHIIEPTLAGLQQEGLPFTGFLYAGLMIGPDETIHVLEYNCRFGDPETQPILLRLKSDFAQLCLAALTGKLSDYTPQWDPDYAISVVLAANGYPDKPLLGGICPTLNDVPPGEGYKIFHAGTQIADGSIITTGGRVLCVSALGETILEAQTKAYRLVKKLSWDGVFYRTDIGNKALKKLI